MIGIIYKRVLNIFKTIPVKLWGLSLLSGLLSVIVLIFGLTPIISIPVIAVISAGMSAIYLSAYNGRDVSSNQMFDGFRDFWHVAGGMCWQYLWLFLWFLIPIAGPVIAIVKSISYSFTPYILMQEKSVTAIDAIKKSKQDTMGHKGKIFAAIYVPAIAFVLLSVVLALLALIPFVGILFAIISFIVSLIYSLFAPMFLELVQAGFYEYIKTPASSSAKVDKKAPKAPCPSCGHENAVGLKFCRKCGTKISD